MCEMLQKECLQRVLYGKGSTCHHQRGLFELLYMANHNIRYLKAQLRAIRLLQTIPAARVRINRALKSLNLAYHDASTV